MNNSIKAALQTLAVAAGYALLGKATFILSTGAGYASPVWPAAGFALGVMLIGGRRLGLGVFIGSYLNNILIGDFASATSHLISLFVGLGAVIQALTAIWLIRRFADYETLQDFRSILRFLLFGAVAACTVNASFGAGILWATGLVPVSGIPETWLIWWLGDTLGVVIFAPITLAIGLRHTRNWSGRWLNVIAVSLVSLIFSVALFQYLLKLDQKKIEQEFNNQAEIVDLVITRTLSDSFRTLNRVRDFLNLSESITRRRFAAFTLPLLEESSAIEALSWNERIPAAARDAFETRMQAEHDGNFRIVESDAEGELAPAANRPDYIVVSFLEPLEENRPALGFDVGSNPVRRRALDEAMITGSAVATARINLIQEQGTHYGVLVFLPYYGTGGIPDTEPERREKIKGYATGVFRIGNLIENALSGLTVGKLDIAIKDTTAPEGQQVLFPRENDAEFKKRIQNLTKGMTAENIGVWGKTIAVPGREWKLEIRPTLPFIYAHRSKTSWFFLLGALFVTAMGTILILTVTGRQKIIEDLVDARTAELREQAENLKQARIQTDAANKSKSEFLASMSHEIRTPMTGVLGFADMLYNDDLPRESYAKVEKIKESTQQLLRIINDILDISKLESGKLEIEFLDIHLRSKLRNVVSMVEGSGRDNLNISMSLADGCPETARTDPTRLRQILFNLVGNAVKFTKQGEVSVACSLIRQDEDQPFLKFVVTDTGIGMAPETISKLFSDFTQADSSISRLFEGTGLGLAICKRLVTMLGGEIGVESTLGKGSAFWFTIPYFEAANNMPDGESENDTGEILSEPATGKNQGGPARSLNVLVAEDNEINQLIVENILKKLGHRCVVVPNGAEAIKAHENGEYDFILMDVRMPHVSGPDASRAIRAMQGPKSEIPIVALTADAMLENRKTYFEAGMNAVTTKPISLAELVNAINSVMGEDIHPPD
ncbi:MAG: CHASE domain-containing protein [Alphaproteobacteria bacterium]